MSTSYYHILSVTIKCRPTKYAKIYLSTCKNVDLGFFRDASFFFVGGIRHLGIPRNSSEANRQIFAITFRFLAELPMEARGFKKVSK